MASSSRDNWLKQCIDSESARHDGVDNLYRWPLQFHTSDVKCIRLTTQIPADTQCALVSIGTVKYLDFCAITILASFKNYN